MLLPSINILIVSFNQENIIEQTVMSAINQDYENFSVVVSDDGSTDSTPDILSQLQKRYPKKLKIILNKKNQGITKNCNTALAACDAELIALSGGDDLFYPTKIRMQAMEFVNNENLVFCYHPCHILSDNKIVDTVGNRNKDIVRSFYEMISNYGADIPGPAPMFLHSAMPESGFNEKIPTASDWLLFIEVSRKGEISRIDEVLAQYRKHPGNVGKRIFTYADDFLKTLEFVSQKYGNDVKVEDSVKIGRRRFLLGILYNAAMSRNSEAFDKYLSIYHSFGYSGSLLLRILNSPWVSVILPKLRSTLKKFV